MHFRFFCEGEKEEQASFNNTDKSTNKLIWQKQLTQ